MTISQVIEAMSAQINADHAARHNPAGLTQEQQEGLQEAHRERLAALDAIIWRRRRQGETVAQVRARLAPGVTW